LNLGTTSIFIIYKCLNINDLGRAAGRAAVTPWLSTACVLSGFPTHRGTKVFDFTHFYDVTNRDRSAMIAFYDEFLPLF
jgi:hypothetical protein